MRKTRVLTWAVFIACGLVALAGSANAASIKSMTETGGAINVGSDNSYELIIDRAGGTDNVLDIGDSLYGIFDIDTYGPEGGTSSIVDNEWTGIFQTLVLDKKFVYRDDNGTPLDPTDDYDVFHFSFGYDAASPWAVTNPGAMVMMFEDGNDDFNIENGPGVDEATATNGTYFWSLGMTGVMTPTADGNPYNDVSDQGESWIARNTRDTVPGVPGNTIGTADFNLNRVINGLLGSAEGWELGSMPNHLGATFMETEFKGTVLFKASQEGSTWPVQDDLTSLSFRVNSIVPVPAAAWMGLALLGALGIGRRLRRR